jgi:hypothetical protein
MQELGLHRRAPSTRYETEIVAPALDGPASRSERAALAIRRGENAL